MTVELDITDFFNQCAPMDYSASAVELGKDAGRITWAHAREDATDNAALLDTEEKKEAFREYVRGFGAWEDEEIKAWIDEELTALLMQMIAGDMRDAGIDSPEDVETFDWKAYEEAAHAGSLSGRIYKGDDARIYYYVGD